MNSWRWLPLPWRMTKASVEHIMRIFFSFRSLIQISIFIAHGDTEMKTILILIIGTVSYESIG